MLIASRDTRAGESLALAVALICGDATTLGTGDQAVDDYLDQQFHVASVTHVDDSAAEVDASDGYDLVVLGPEAAVGAAYFGDAAGDQCPILDLAGFQQVRERCTGTLDSASITTIYYDNATELAWMGQTTGTNVAISGTAGLHETWPTIPADAHIMCYKTSSKTYAAVWLFDVGDTLDNGTTDVDARVACFPLEIADTANDLSAECYELLDNLIGWCMA